MLVQLALFLGHLNEASYSISVDISHSTTDWRGVLFGPTSVSSFVLELRISAIPSSRAMAAGIPGLG